MLGTCFCNLKRCCFAASLHSSLDVVSLGGLQLNHALLLTCRRHCSSAANGKDLLPALRNGSAFELTGGQHNELLC